MAGAGYKLFNTGDVLTAAQVNTYLMEQTVMVFADAAARTTALSGVVAEGMLSYLKSTKQVEVYNGSAWVASDDPNAIQNTIVDAKGDLITATAADTPARLAVGSNGDTLVADSAATTGLRWQGNYSAGKNKIINGALDIWQRGTSFSVSTGVTWTADRFFVNRNGSGATVTVSRQDLTPGDPVAGFPGKYFWRFNQTVAGTGATFSVIQHQIEDVQNFNGQTFTISFWAKADASRSINVLPFQYFGTGGSSTANAGNQSVTLTTSWARYSLTYTMPSISGKTIGAGSFVGFEVGLPLNTTQTIDITGWQMEVGNVATAFQTATGTLQGELAACQRYYYLHCSGVDKDIAGGWYWTNTDVRGSIKFPVTMRVAPTGVIASGTNYYRMESANVLDDFNGYTVYQPSTNSTLIYADANVSGTQGYAGWMRTLNASSSIAFSAEL